MDVVGVGIQLVITLQLPRSGYELTGSLSISRVAK